MFLSLSSPAQALQYIPDTAELVITGKDLSNLSNNAWGQFWTQLTATISTRDSNIITPLIKPLTDIENHWQINLSEDIFSWVQGEYVLALLPTSNKQAPEWILIVEQSDGATGISRLDKIAAHSGLSRNSFSLHQQKILSWTQIQADVNSTQSQKDKSFNVEAEIKGLHTTLGDYEIFTSSIATMDVVLTVGEDNITKNTSFQKSLNHISSFNQDYVYFNWQNGK
ncbi:MAG: DUF3352 domain-containing protein [Richelia sp.]|nr:DUF3352 domain-containing protein [Richelia sp.]